MDVKNMNLDAMIEHGYLVKATSITKGPGKVYVHLTDTDGSEQLYQYVPQPEKVRPGVQVYKGGPF